MKEKTILISVYCAFLAVMSLIAFTAYAADKIRAKKGMWRISEKVLLTLSLSGGAVGGYAAMNLCRHKTKRWYFHVLNIFGLVWQIGLLLFLLVRL